MSKKKPKKKHGPRTKSITIRCVNCNEAFESSREDAVCCSAKCRKMRSRWALGEDVRVIQRRAMPPKGVTKGSLTTGHPNPQTLSSEGRVKATKYRRSGS